jgi:hypothetical protein
MDPGILAFEFPITVDMSASGIRTLTIYPNRYYLAPELEALNRDFGHTFKCLTSALSG